MIKRLPKRKNVDPRLKTTAKTIQAAMKQRGLDVPGLTEALSLEVSQRGAVANWVSGVNGVGPRLRSRVAEVLGLREDQLTLEADTLGRRPRGLGPAQRAVTLVQNAAVNGELLPAPAPVSDVFSIRARSDGSMTVRLDVSLPFAKGAQLVQFLMSFGLAPGSAEDTPP